MRETDGGATGHRATGRDELPAATETEEEHEVTPMNDIVGRIDVRYPEIVAHLDDGTPSHLNPAAKDPAEVERFGVV